MNYLLINDIISMTIGKKRKLFRVLKIWRNKNNFTAISIEPKKSSGRTYFNRHKNFMLDETEYSISSIEGDVRIERFIERTEVLLSDEEIEVRFPAKKGEDISSHLTIRNDRWNLIKPIIIDYSETLYDLELFHQNIKTYVEPNRFSNGYVQKIKETIYQYFAGGLNKNSLIPFFASCGARGKERKIGTKKLGKPNSVTQSGVENYEGYILKEIDFEIIKQCWEHFVKRNVSVNSAYLRMCRDFYSVRIQGFDGHVNSELLPVHERPTESQFNYQGTKLTGKSAEQLQLKHNEFTHRLRALLGNANDGIKSVGQLGAIDSTSTDVQLCSLLNRLDRIGFAHRELLVDSMYGYIPGFYMGLSSPSASTVKLAVLHALSDKTEWLKSLGLEEDCPVDDWIPIQFSSFLSDNGELRSAEINQVMLESGMITSLSYIPSYQSDKNSIVETMHRRIHKLSDHNLLGSTYGQNTERGDEKAEERARHTLFKAIKDSARWAHHHNTTPQPERILPLEMKRDGVKPSPLEMTRWAIKNNYLSSNLMDINEAKIKLLPSHSGVFTAQGVKLLRPDKGKQRVYIRCLRYVSKHKKIINNMEKARAKGIVNGNFLIDIFNLNIIWFKDIYSGELIPLDFISNDMELKEKGTWSDVMAIEVSHDVERYYLNDEKNCSLSSCKEKQQQMNEDSNNEYNKALSESDKKLSKAKITGDRKSNRVREMDNLLFGMPIMLSEPENSEITPNNEINGATEIKAATAQKNSHSSLIKQALEDDKS